MSEASRPLLAQAIVRSVLATLLLLVGEVLWLEDRGLVAAPERLIALLAQLATVVAACELTVALLWNLSRLLAPRHVAGAFTLFMLAPLALAGHSLFSGNAIREVAGVQLFKLAFVIIGLGAVRLVVGLHRGLRRGRYARARRLLVAGGALVCWLALWVDTHVQVGLYPAFHLLLGAGAVLAAATSARGLQLGGRLELPNRVVAAGAVLVLAAVGATWFAWASPSMVAVAAYSDGLAPKLRQVVVAASGGSRVELPVAVAADHALMPRRPEAPADSNRLAAARALEQPPWTWPAGEGRVEADAAPGPDDGQRADRVLFPAGDDARLEQAVARDGPDEEWLASVWVRAAGSEAGADGRASADAAGDAGVPARRVRLELGDGAGHVVEGPLVQPGPAWSRLTLGPLRVVPPELPGSQPLDAAAVRHDTGFAWNVNLPPEWRGLASDSTDSARSPLRLFEDGTPLGPGNALHATIREQGRGTYSHWQGLLYFSTSDGSDPRHNGRRYELVLQDEDRPERGPGDVLFRLVAEPGEQPLPVLVADCRLERLGGPDEGVSSLPRPVAPSGGWASEFAFVPTRTPAAQAVRAATRNVVVVLMDAFRDDHVGRVVDGESITPNLDALLAESVRFTRTYSPSDHTGRSVPCLMTSLPLAVTLGAADNDVPLPTWLSLLREGGYRSFHVGSNYVFRKYAHIRLPPVYGAEEHGTLDSKADGLERQVLDFAARDDDRPFAVFAHWSDAHVGRQKDMARVYREGVRAADARLGRLVQGLRDQGVWHETLLVVTSDHGYALGEDRRYLTSQGVDEQSVRVPFVLRLPGSERAGVTVDVPVSGHDLFGTVLDVMLPEARVAAWSSGVLDLALEPGGHEPWAVHSSTGWSHMLRLGDDKLVEDDTQDTRLLFDVEADAEEQHPDYGGARLAELRGVLAAAREREVRLLRALVAGTQEGLPEHVLARLIDDELELGAVRAVLDGFWQLDASTRRFVLRTLYQRGFDEIRFDLERLARNGWNDDDQVLLVMRAWAGSRPAVRTLEARLHELSAEGMRWLVELLPDLPDTAVQPLAPALIAELERLQAQQPLVGSDDERRLALLAYALAEVLRQDAPESVQRALVGRFNAWSSGEGPGPYFATLRTRKFIRRNFLTALRRTMDEGDLELLADIVLNRDVAIAVPEICLRLDSERSRGFLLDMIRRWDVPGDERGGALSYMLPTLRRFEDTAFRDEANRIIQANYPLVWKLQ